jgi:hypothetical protein
VLVQSINGPAFTFIQGYHPIAASLTNAVRCAYLGSNATLAGFTLTNGSAGTGNYIGGGGVSGRGAVISNCVLIGNYAGYGGGGYFGTYIGCLFIRNVADSAGAASYAALVNCIITNNSAGWVGAIDDCTATNCVIAGNRATNYAGCSELSKLVNCTVAFNSVPNGDGGGSYHDTLYNCIVYGNTGSSSSNYYSSSLTYCCTAPVPAGAGNFSSAPGFVDANAGNFRLRADSSCVNAGANSFAPAGGDVEGNARISSGTVDVGAYEFQNSATLSGPALSSNQFRFTVMGNAGSSYIIQAASSLIAQDWTNLATNQCPFSFTNSMTLPARLYRALAQ